MGAGLAIMFILLVLAFIFGGISEAINSWGKSKHGEENWSRMQQAAKEEEARKKYNNYMYKCPVCGSKKVTKISQASRTASVGFWGLASDKIGKQYECNNCWHKW